MSHSWHDDDDDDGFPLILDSVEGALERAYAAIILDLVIAGFVF